MNAIEDLVQRGFLLCSDTKDMLARLLQAGIDAGVPPPPPAGRQPTQLASCQRP
jgi:hypothetical protein